MKDQSNYMMKLICLFALLLLPACGFAAIGNFFAPPPSDISLQVMQNIFGTGTDALNGKLIRPLLMVFSTGIVVFMGAIFGWNLTKFVLHTAQEGEMMVGKGKQMGLVILRSVFGISMVIPAYSSAAYKGLSLSFIFVAWLITQGIGLADRGVNAIVDYLAAGGTIYQVAQVAQDTSSRQAMVKPALDVLASEVCLYQLRQASKNYDGVIKGVNDLISKTGGTPVVITPSAATDVGFYFDPNAGQVSFGSRKRNGNNAFFADCGTVSWPVDASNPQRNFVVATAMLQMIMDLDPLAQFVAKNYPSSNASALSTQIQTTIANSLYNYTNLVSPLRVQSADAATKAAYNTLQSIKARGWLVLGAYYPIMGNLNQNNKQPLTAYSFRTILGGLKSGQKGDSVNGFYDFGKILDQDMDNIKSQFNYVASQESNTKALIAFLDAGQGSTLQEQLALPASGAPGTAMYGPFQIPAEAVSEYINGRANGASGDQVKNRAANFDFMNPNSYKDIASSAGNAAWDYTAYAATKGPTADLGKKFFGLGGEANNTGVTLGGLLDHGKLETSATAVGLASAVGGPMAWVTIPPSLVVFVAIVDRFRNALDQTQSGDPLIALQDFGFYVMDQAMILLGVVLGGTLLATVVGFIPSINAVGMLGVSANFVGPIFAMFFAALAAAGFGFGIYIPMIPLIVWISAIIGWIGHSFQAIIGAPLVALRMTTAEGEGLLGGATEGVMMLLGVLLTPFLLVVGFSATLILLKQILIVVNYLFSLFAMFSFSRKSDSFAWVIIGAPAILLVYFTLITTMVQALCTKLIGEFPGEVLRHLHTAMTGHKAAEQMMGKMEQASEKGAGQAGELGGKGVSTQTGQNIQGAKQQLGGGL